MLRGILRAFGIGKATTVATVPAKVEASAAPPAPTGMNQFFDPGHEPKLETKMMPTTAMLEAYKRAGKPGAEKREKRRHHKQARKLRKGN
jgi:hypothetical protein